MNRRHDTGAVAVELALVLPIAITVIFSTIYGGLYFYYSAAASHIARAVARDASIPDHGQYPSAADETTFASAAAGRMLPAPTSVSLNADPEVGAGNELTVTVTYDLPALTDVASLLPFLPGSSGTMTRTVTVRYE